MVGSILGGVLLNAIVFFGVSEGTERPIVPSFGSLQARERLERLDESKLKQLVQNRHGRALLVNVWATWCGPCVEEFPDLVRLANDMKERKIDFVGVSGDDFEDESTNVVPFIEREKASFKFYMAKLEGEDKFIEAFDKNWGGGIPATFIYDSLGVKKAFLLGKQTYRTLKAASQKALGY